MDLSYFFWSRFGHVFCSCFRARDFTSSIFSVSPAVVKHIVRIGSRALLLAFGSCRLGVSSGARKAQRLVFLSFWCVPFVESFRLFLCGSFGMDGSFEVVLDICDGFFSGVGVSVCNQI